MTIKSHPHPELSVCRNCLERLGLSVNEAARNAWGRIKEPARQVITLITYGTTTAFKHRGSSLDALFTRVETGWSVIALAR